MANKQYQKSIQQAYNTASQSYVATGTILNLLGTKCTDCGCSIETQQAGFVIEKNGAYYISADVTSTPTAAGTQIIQFLKDGVALPCSITTNAVVSGSAITQHIETVIPINACCAVNPIITLRISGVAGAVSFVRASVIKLA